MSRKEGFTLVEVLVASLLLGMLVTILTMVFNQSSIAWRTGKASVAEMDDMRRYYSQVQRYADNALPGASGSEAGRICGAWAGDGNLRNRALMQWNDAVANLIDKDELDPEKSSKGGVVALDGKSFKTKSVSSYTVGVWSYGPDGLPNTGDDISTWPVDVE